MQPRPYQEIGRDFLAGRRFALLADEMRVGKTAQAILAAAKIGAKRTLVLCPAIAVPVWRDQWAQWRPGAPVSPVVMSYEKALIEQDRLLAQAWDVTVIDECHFAGNPEAKRTKMIYGKGGLVHRTDRLWALSGTPAPKHAGSLWPLLYTSGIVGLRYYEFIQRYCRIDFLSQRPIGTKEQHIPELRALWRKIGLRRTRKEVAPELPDIGFDFLPVDIDSPVDLAGDLATADDALLARAGETDREDRVAVALAKARPLVQALASDLQGGLVKQTVVFGWHLDALREVTRLIAAAGFSVEMISGEVSQSKRTAIQDRFRAGELDVIVGQIRACGTAIDLSAASHAYFLELDWVPASNVQAANRLIAIGKTEPVTVDVVTVPGTIDDHVQRILLRRAREIARLI
jgi:SWI/SNF-related matrix-associated actin-dependent regulator 1 of chromatin subfamily A